MADQVSSGPGSAQARKPQPIVLAGFAEALSAPESVWSLIDAGFRVIAFARKNRHCALRHSRYVVCHGIGDPEVDLQQSLADLRALMASIEAEANGVSLIFFPLDDKAVWLGSKLGPSSTWVLAGPTGAQAELALHKCVQTRMAREAGFLVPETQLARSAADIFQFAKQQSFPIILKSADCVPEYQGRIYSCRTWICANEAELERAVSQWGERVPLLAQSYVVGVGEGVFGLATPEGVQAWSGHRRVRMMNPQGSGSSACASQPVTQELKDKAEKLVTKAGWRGLFMIELLRDDSGQLWFVELNGRPWGSMALSRRQGFEYPAWHVRLALGDQANLVFGSLGIKDMVCRNAGREFMHLLFVLKGAKSNALAKWPSLWGSLRDMLTFHRKDAFYNWRRDDAKVFFADFYFTVHDNIFKSSH